MYDENLKKDITESKIVLGGCSVTDDDPDFHFVGCQALIYCKSGKFYFDESDRELYFLRFANSLITKSSISTQNLTFLSTLRGLTTIFIGGFLVKKKRDRQTADLLIVNHLEIFKMCFIFSFFLCFYFRIEKEH